MVDKKKVLVINLVPEVYAKVAPLLDRGEFEVDLFPRASHALEILSEIPFDALVAGFPLPEESGGRFLDAIREPGAINRRTPLLLITEAAFQGDAQALVGRGASRVVAMEETAERLQSEISDLIVVAPRSDLRFMLRMKIHLEDGRQLALGQTDNVSRTGMLVSGGEAYPIGSKLGFEFFIGQESSPVIGHGVVVRHTTPGRESIGGMGIRFDKFEKDGQRRLFRYLDRLEEGSGVR